MLFLCKSDSASDGFYEFLLQWAIIVVALVTFIFPGYKQALAAIAGCGALSAFCCICFCWMKHKKRECFSISHFIEIAMQSNVIATDLNSELFVCSFLTGKKLAQVRSVLKCTSKQLHPFVHTFNISKVNLLKCLVYCCLK